jgi:predicted ATP-grasp superfamily ATP-dependent carboligase
MKILVTDGGYTHTLGIIRTLAKAGHTVDCIGEQRCLASFSRYTNRVSYLLRDFNESKIDRFIAFLSVEKYDILIPVGAVSVEFISKNIRTIQQMVKVALPERESVLLALSKRETAKLAERCQVPVPKIYNFSPQKLAEPADFSRIRYPVVVKASNEIGKSPPRYANNRCELDMALEAFKHDPQPIVQQKITGEAYGFFALYKGGEIQSFFMHRRIRENPPTGGASVCAESVFEIRLYEYGKRLLDALNWNGVAMVEFKRSNNGEFYLIEINPKFWGSLDLAIAAGVDFPNLLVGLFDNESCRKSPKYKVGLRFHWPLDGDLGYILDRPASTHKILRDLFSPNVKTNISACDPLPHVFTLIKNCIRNILKWSRLKLFVSRILSIGAKNAAIRTLTELTGLPFMPHCEIDGGLAVGMQPTKLGFKLLKILGYNCVLSLRSEFDERSILAPGSELLVVPIDEYCAPTVEQIETGVEFIASRIQCGKRVYVHCREGVSRAPLFAAAYLIKKRRIPVHQVIDAISTVRPYVCILENQMSVLKLYEEKMLKSHV